MKVCAQCQIKYPDALEYCPQDGARLPDTTAQTQALYDPYLGSTIDGRYLIEAKLGEGGMGVVYAARHVIIDKRVAIKVLKKEAQAEETASQRFIQEAKSASKIGHANIVDITDFGMMPDGSAYFVMEFLEGQTLGQVVHEGPLPARRVVAIAAQIARGLNAAHGKGIVHRDLKPENIFLLERDGHSDVVKIVDFGIAKVQSALGQAATRLTQVGMVLGTPEYMAPEMATGKETDHRVDEYALGCIVYEMLTGDVPFKADSSAGTLTKHVFEPLIPPSRRRPDLGVPAALEAVCVRALAKAPDDRFAGMRQLLEALDAAGAEIPSGPGGSADRTKPTRVASAVRPTLMGDDLVVPRRPIGLMAAVGAAVAATVVLGGWLAFGRNHPPRAPQVAVEVERALPPPVVEAAPPPPARPDPPPEVSLTLRSLPTGADIFLGDQHIGVAPLEYQHLRGDQPLVFVFKLPGYKDGERELTPDRNLDVDVTLLRREGHPHRPIHSADTRAAVAPPPRPVEAPVAPPAKPKSNGELRDPF